jgi:transcriptional regulator with XRE-family HTH domain
MGDSAPVPALDPDHDASLVALGRAIRALRAESKMTQEQLAVKVGIHATYITRIEAGHRNISWRTMKQLSLGLGVSVSRLAQAIEQMEQAQRE